MIIDAKGEYVGGPRCGERFAITSIAPPQTVRTVHIQPARFSEPVDYRLSLDNMPGRTFDGSTYRYVYVKPEKVDA